MANQPRADEQALPNHLEELAWAYAISTTEPPPLPKADGKLSLPDTPLTFTREEIVGSQDSVSFLNAPADWYPGDHPEMPDIYTKNLPPRWLTHPSGR